MKTLAGTGTLVRVIVRRDRIRAPIWFAIILAIVAATPPSIRELYPTQAELAAFAATAEDNPAVILMQGPVQGLDTIGGRVAFELGAQLAVVIGLMNILMVGRHTREEEESGRTELLRSGVLGEHAPIAASMVVAVVGNLLLGSLIAAVLVALDLPARGSVTLAAGLAGSGIVFAAMTALFAQVSEFTRSVYTMGIAGLGLAFLLRAVGDVSDGTLSWLSPIGWGQAARPFAEERAWPLLLQALATAGFLGVALALQDRRDLGAGLTQPRPGRPTASDFLVRPVGLAMRLQRTVVYSWAAGLLVLGLLWGSIGVNVEDLVGDNPDMRDILAQSGVDNLVDSYFATVILLTALIAGVFAVQSTLRLRGEETGLRAEALLTTGLPRWRWATSHLCIALAGSVLLMVFSGLGTGIAHAVRTEDSGEVLRLTAAALAHVPALWLLAGLALFLFGVAPRFTGLAWALVAFAFVVGLLGQLLQLPDWAMAISPFYHVPEVPARDFNVIPEIVLTALAAVLMLAGLAGFRRRDIG